MDYAVSCRTSRSAELPRMRGDLVVAVWISALPSSSTTTDREQCLVTRSGEDGAHLGFGHVAGGALRRPAGNRHECVSDELIAPSHWQQDASKASCNGLTIKADVASDERDHSARNGFERANRRHVAGVHLGRDRRQVDQAILKIPGCSARRHHAGAPPKRPSSIQRDPLHRIGNHD